MTNSRLVLDEEPAEVLEDGAGSLEQVESLVKQAYEDGLLPNDDQPS